MHDNQGFTGADRGRAHWRRHFPRRRHALDTVCDPRKTVAAGYGVTYMAASNLMQTAQSLIRGTVRGIVAQRQVTVRVAVTWAAHVDTCARVLAVSAQCTRFWFHHSVRVTLYAAHRARQRVLLGTLSSLRCLATRALRHMDVLELALRSELAHTATIAWANISHQQPVY